MLAKHPPNLLRRADILSARCIHLPGPSLSPPTGCNNLPMKEKKLRSYHWYAFVGGASGGCLLPLILFLLAAASGDAGGPLFWLIITVLFGMIGILLGEWFHGRAQKRK